MPILHLCTVTRYNEKSMPIVIVTPFAPLTNASAEWKSLQWDNVPCASTCLLTYKIRSYSVIRFSVHFSPYVVRLLGYYKRICSVEAIYVFSCVSLLGEDNGLYSARAIYAFVSLLGNIFMHKVITEQRSEDNWDKIFINGNILYFIGLA
jgi:hypothetical protein